MKIDSEQEMLDFGRSFAKKITFPTVIELIGDVGAGKTTFTRGLAEGLGVKSQITSPSFTISKSYALPNNKKLIHYDFYRLNDVGLMANNLKEAISSNNVVVIEWGESIKNVLPKNKITISLKLQNDGSRRIVIEDNRNSVFRDTDIKNSRSSVSRGLPEVTTARRRRSVASDEGASPVTTGASDPSPENTVRLFLDTSTPETVLRLNDKEYKYPFANDLAEKLLEFIKDKLDENNYTWQDITEITFMSGPGSFTGLRIGASIVNTLAHELRIPLYDHKGQKHDQIIPDYGRAANISKPVK